MKTGSSENRYGSAATSILIAALWFGLVAGLLEGVGLMSLQRFGRMPGVWVEILWVSPFFDAILFGLGGLALAAVSRLFPRLPVLPFAVFSFAFLALSIWLGIALPWQVHIAALLLLALGLAFAFTRWFSSREDRVMRFWRRSLPAAAAIAILVFAVVQGGGWVREKVAVATLPEAAEGAPNILLIVVDSLRADHLSAYGYERSTSPNLDRIAQEGVLFETALSTAPYTAPSHASLLTGRYPHDHGVQWIERRPTYDGRYVTIAEALRERGYRTGAVSANRFWFTREQGFGRGFTHFEDNFHTPGDMAVRTSFGQKFEKYILKRYFKDYPWRRGAPDVNASLLDWLGQDQDRPFFAFINYFDVHDPYFPPQPYRGMYSSLEEPGGIVNSHQERYDPALTPAQIQEEMNAYDGAISYVDSHIALLLDDINEMGMADNLLVIVTSDHGEAFGEHGTFVHANSVYREEVHVPLIFWMPGTLPSGVRIEQPVTNSAIPATILDLLLLDESEQGLFPGPSLARLWTSPGAYPDWPFPLAEMEHWPWMPETSPSHLGAMRSLVSQDRHYIEHTTLGTELYDWNSDPLEARDLSGSDEGQAIIDWFKSSLTTVLARKP